jgi:type I restriction enzyme S subunit
MNIKYCPLTDLLEFIVDNRGKTVPTEDRGIVLIATNCIKNNELFPVFEKVRYLSRSTYENWFRAHPIPGDIIFVNKGTPGRVCLVPDPVNFCIAQDMVAFRANPEKIYNKYLFAALRSDSIQEQIGNMHVGTLIPHVKKSHLDKLLIPVLDIISQRAIGDFYYEISNKIELNNRIIANLEAQAQAIFKSWFVDFEPFQDGEFEESELGLIPKGWRVGTFSEIIEKLIPGDWGKDRPEGNNTQEVFCIRGADIPEVRNGNKGKMPVRHILPKNYVSKQLEANDLVAEISGGSPTQSTGRIALITKSLLARYDKPMVCTNFCKAMKPRVGFAAFIYYYWQYLYDLKVLFSYENGTTGIKNLNINGFVEVELIVIPDDPTATKFNDIVMGFQEIVFSLGKQNEQLALIRDTLLPKLMSGEIEVPVEG